PSASATTKPISRSRVGRSRDIFAASYVTGTRQCSADLSSLDAMLRYERMKEAVELLGLTKAELVSFVETLGEPAYRGRQIFGGLQHRRLRSFDEMSDLPKQLRTRLT